MQVLYKSTRGKEEAVTASMAILKGLSEDGGLFVPTEIPKLDVSMDKLAQMSYQETAYEVMKRFLTDFTEEELKTASAGPMTINLIQKQLHHFMRQTEYISWSCIMELPLHSRIWLYQFFHIL